MCKREWEVSLRFNQAMAEYTLDSAAADLNRLGVPGLSLADQAEKRRSLRIHKTIMTGLLVVAAIIFIICTLWLKHLDGNAAWWVGLLRAGAEAGMVGGLADWFAVTALFRHPMGLPIPHTALVPRKKDQIAGDLSKFVGDNFLNADQIAQQISNANLSEKLGSFLAQPENAELVTDKACQFTVHAINAIDRTEAEALINQQVISRFTEPAWGPPLGRILDALIADGKVEPVVQEIISWGRVKVREMEPTVVTLIDERMPRWAPRFAKELVGERVYRELVVFMAEVDTDPQHEARGAIRRTLSQFAQDLQFDVEMITRIEELKQDIMGSHAAANLAGELWDAASESLIDAAVDPNSYLRRRGAASAQRLGERINNDALLREDLDRRIEGLARWSAKYAADEITGMIAKQIQSWDGQEAAEKIEVEVGKDLQFIRLNGTIVGALAGIAIYTVSHFLL